MADPAAVDLRLDPATHDLALVNGDLYVERDEGEVLAQRIRVRLRHWVNEWYLDRTAYVRWIQVILKKGARREAVAAELRRVILDAPGVRRISRLTIDYVGATRLAKIDGIVDSTIGTVRVTS